MGRFVGRMDRRTFMGLLGAAAAAPLLPQIDIIRDLPNGIEETWITGTKDFGYITGHAVQLKRGRYAGRAGYTHRTDEQLSDSEHWQARARARAVAMRALLRLEAA